LHCAVLKLHVFASFKELYESLPLLSCGYTEEDVGIAHYSDMDEYYTPQKQKEYGVVGIELIKTSLDTEESI
jgi:ASC-1-like (ASCH) protein